MLKIILTIIAVLAVSVNAFAKMEAVSKVEWKHDNYKVTAILYYDKDTKKPDLWVEYEEGKDKEKVAFKATSVPTWFSQASHKLAQMPVAKIDGTTTVIYDGYDLKTNEYEPDYGMAVIFHYPIDDLPAKTREIYLKNFPKSIVKDPAGKPTHIKSLLCRVTGSQVYPILAFDSELAL